MFQGTKAFFLMLFVVVVSAGAVAQQDRITSVIDAAQTVVLKGSVSPLAQPQNDLGPLDPSMKLTYVTMLLQPSAAQKAALEQLLAEQQDPSSPNYHKWLTPEQYGERFGLSHGDIATINRWLRGQGFRIAEVARGRNWIAFSGTVRQIEQVFHTQIDRFIVDGEVRFANVSDPSVPKALEGIVSGFRGLNNFKLKPAIIQKSVNVSPDYTDGSGNHWLAPDDIASIYHVGPLYTAGIDGTGMYLAIMGQTDINAADIQQFRSGFNLSVNDPIQVLASGCNDPGITGDEVEADLDLEWSGAVARNASVIFVKCDSANGGVIGSLQYAINNLTAPVMSMSYGLCEAEAGPSFEASYQTLIQQANLQGQTLMVSSGDNGAAGCDSPSSTQATLGKGVNAFASPPEVTAVGGTEFDADVNNPSTYWSSSNGTNLGSALRYIPEFAWNDGALGTNLQGGLWSTGGGASIYFTRPAWQTGTGTFDATHRSLPDVSMPASLNHDGYVFCTAGSCASGIVGDGARVGGTSAAAPVFAGIVVLLNHYLSNKGFPSAQGNINPNLYALAASTPSAFHDVPAGSYSLNPSNPSSNIVPCQPTKTDCTSSPFQFGFLTGTGYDQATGWGSVDADVFVTNWPTSGEKTTTTTVLAITPSSTVTVGTSVTLTATVTPTPPDGDTVIFTDTNTATTLGRATTSSGTAAFTSSTIAEGSYNVVAKYSGDAILAFSMSAASPLTVQLNATTTTLAITPSATVTAGTSVTLTATITPAPPNGETVTFADSTSGSALGTAKTSSGTAAFTSSTIKGGSYNVVAKYPGDATMAASISAASALNVQDFTLSPSTLNITVSAPGQSGSGTITFGLFGGLSQVPSFSCSGTPYGASCSFASASATTETVTIGTTAASWLNEGPLGHGNGIFYALLFPGLAGLVLPAGRGKRATRAMIGLMMLLAVLTLWMPACGSGGGGKHNPGTPVGQTSVTVTATESSISHTITINLNVQ